MNNWDYAQTIPTGNWRSAMTIPRVVGLTNSDEGYRLTQQPVGELQQLRFDKKSFENRELTPDNPAEDNWLEFKGKAYEAVIEFDAGSAEQFGIRLRKGGGEETVIGYDVVEQRLYLDRTRSGETDFDSTFASVEEAPVVMENNRIRLHLFVDWSSVEVFADEGKVAITDRVFPSPKSDGIELFAEGGTAEMISMDIWRLRSAWTVHESNSNKNNNY
jgi:fructan beta-fructosidase